MAVDKWGQGASRRQVWGHGPFSRVCLNSARSRGRFPSSLKGGGGPLSLDNALHNLCFEGANDEPRGREPDSCTRDSPGWKDGRKEGRKKGRVGRREGERGDRASSLAVQFLAHHVYLKLGCPAAPHKALLPYLPSCGPHPSFLFPGSAFLSGFLAPPLFSESPFPLRPAAAYARGQKASEAAYSCWPEGVPCPY